MRGFDSCYPCIIYKKKIQTVYSYILKSKKLKTPSINFFKKNPLYLTSTNILTKVIKISKVNLNNHYGFIKFISNNKKNIKMPTYRSYNIILFIYKKYFEFIKNPQFFVKPKQIHNNQNSLNIFNILNIMDESFKYTTSILTSSYYYINNFKFLNTYEFILIKFWKKNNTNINIFKNNTLTRTKNIFFEKFKIIKSNIELNNINKYLKLSLFKNKLKNYTHIKLYFNHNNVLKIKNNSSIFTSSPFRQITLNLFRFAENTSQLKTFQSLKLLNTFVNNLFNLNQITLYFNWENYFIPMFTSSINQFKFFNKLHFFFINF